ncbi:MAG TPA: hypothetical protein VMW54_02240 [Terriglobia bacterium]|nr:hypothetical protein [Terriglobia bacterium]
MSEIGWWPWAALALLGAYHGINPGMGWLFAVALGMQERNPWAVWRSLGPLAAGHALSIGAVVLLAVLIQVVLPLRILKAAVAAILFTLGLYHLVRHRHPKGGGMTVGFKDLTIWSFLMASAHGAGLMVLPILFGMVAAGPDHGTHAAGHAMHRAQMGGGTTQALAVVVHTAGYLVVTGLIAWLVYEKLGLALLRRAWLNLDLIWCIALVATGCFVLIS